jgi:hypothetical protein
VRSPQLAVVLAGLALVGAGCGGGGATKTAPVQPTADAVAHAFILAAAAGKAGAPLRRRFAPFAKGYKTLVSERITGPFGLIGIRRGDHVAALLMRRTASGWKVEQRQELGIRALGPQPGAPRLAARARSARRGRLRECGRESGRVCLVLYRPALARRGRRRASRGQGGAERGG